MSAANITIEVRTTCPTCGGRGREVQEEFAGSLSFRCVGCNGTGTVVDAERSKWLRTVAVDMANETWVQAFPQGGFSCSACDTIDAHADDCPHELAKKVLA